MAKNKDDIPSMDAFDRVIHEPARLLIMTYLSLVDTADFVFLTRETQLTRGNLSSHLRTLENAGYIAVEKEFIDRKPRTLLKITKEGRQALSKYRKDIGQIIGNIPE
jgi:DNA-binding MarR family transcriptional regulator